MEYDAHQRHANFTKLHQNIEMIETLPLTEDRLVGYKKHIRFLRDYFEDFTLTNSEITDHRFRSAAVQAETYMVLLEQDFDTRTYYLLLKTILFMANQVFEDDTLENMMANLGF